MRFTEDGPAIPDELLIALDEGRVMLFCGAGVSKARAKMPSFWELAQSVADVLGVPDEHPIRKIIGEASETEKRWGTAGLVSADRIFGLLERDFPLDEIEAAVASSLNPKEDVDLSAHQLLLKLARTPDGRTYLVTTNFDRLFDVCDPSLHVWSHPRLPDFSRDEAMDGIVYLHGCVNHDYSGSEGNGLILSTSGFGRAYLAEGWATEFFRQVIDKYVVLFVGYSADDPPVQYLLEGLRRGGNLQHSLYVFQAGEKEEDIAKWHQKGITSIPYDDGDDHQPLWRTLEAWAGRTASPDEWFQSVVNMAGRGPRELRPFERGQVAHVVSTLPGARMFAAADPLPPAEWLCVFDPGRRYATSGNLHEIDDWSTWVHVDPFDYYGLDSDVAPDRCDPTDRPAQRKAPVTAWDAFAWTESERTHIQIEGLPMLRGYHAGNIPCLPPRLSELAKWIGKTADQPASVWWAAQQDTLHPEIQQRIRWQLCYSPRKAAPVILKNWELVLRAYKEGYREFSMGKLELARRVERYGWDEDLLMAYSELTRPYLKSGLTMWPTPLPPNESDDARLSDFIGWSVEYPHLTQEPVVPEEWLAPLIKKERENLEHGVWLETQIEGYGLDYISSLVPGQTVSDRSMSAVGGFSTVLWRFCNLFTRLVTLDWAAALREMVAWPSGNSVFVRLRIWACSIDGFLEGEAVAETIENLDDDMFWDSHSENDLLSVLAARWDELPVHTREQVEKRLLAGRDKYVNEDADEYRTEKAESSLTRIVWLTGKGCVFSADMPARIEYLKKLAPSWKPEFAESAADSGGGRAGWRRTETDDTALRGKPLSSLIAEAESVMREQRNPFVEKNPFKGLCVKRPIRAFSALRVAAANGEFPLWAWNEFLQDECRQKDRMKFIALIAERFISFPNAGLKKLLRPVARWTEKNVRKLVDVSPAFFERLVGKLIEVLAGCEAESKQENRSRNRLVIYATGAPAGMIAGAIMDDTRVANMRAGQGFPTEWLEHAENLLALQDGIRKHAVVIFARDLYWLYTVDPEWTETHILKILDGSGREVRDAFWAGFLWSGKCCRSLFLRLKNEILGLVGRQEPVGCEHAEAVAGKLLQAWTDYYINSGGCLLTNSEMRTVLLQASEDIRLAVLRILMRGASQKQEGEDDNLPWGQILPDFLGKAWPKQNSVRTPKASCLLCELAFSQEEHFQPIAEAVLPLLTVADATHVSIPELADLEHSSMRQFPDLTLALLYAILPPNTRNWPYGIVQLLDELVKADNSLASDNRMLELRRRWNSL